MRIASGPTVDRRRFAKMQSMAARPSRSGVSALPAELDRRFEAAILVESGRTRGRTDLRRVVDELSRFSFDVAVVSGEADSRKRALEQLLRDGILVEDVLVV